jgi:hypothetical protein
MAEAATLTPTEAERVDAIEAKLREVELKLNMLGIMVVGVFWDDEVEPVGWKGFGTRPSKGADA